MRALIQAVVGGPGFAAARRVGYSDVVLAVAAVTIIGVMILPLPLAIIDMLVALNIAIGFGLLLLAIYIPSPLAFSSFPSVLLLTTLFRLALSIAITRSILLNADGGHIVETFGSLVAGGNLVVGLVVFLIITVVQFIVIAKGAERVAEVAARFTLDAMPGKQLSIDSDLRSGLIDKDEARRKRRLLETESQLHGSLDGAMKFVKGDAIAGVVIIVINLLGGLAIGVLQHDMSLADASRTYSILTIGDGLVAQIPAILATIAAGLVVTRTAGDENDRHLGESITRQVSGQPRVMLITGALALLMTLVPGFPGPVFLMLGLGLLAVAAYQYRDRLPMLQRLFGSDRPATSLPLDVEDDPSPPPPLALHVSADLAEAWTLQALSDGLHRLVRGTRDEFGVPLPVPAVEVRGHFESGEYRLVAHGNRLAQGRLDVQNRLLVSPGAAPLPNFHPVLTGTWASGGGDGLSALDALMLHCRRSLQRRLAAFVGIQEASRLYTRMQRDYPELVKELLRAVPPQRVAEVLRRLVEEGLPIRNLRDIFEAIAEAGTREKDVAVLTEGVRMALKRDIAERYADAERTLKVLLIHPDLEDRLRQSLRTIGGMPQLAVSPEQMASLMSQLRPHATADAERPPVLVCSLDVRRHLRKLTEIDFFDLPVLSYQELAPDLRIVQAGQIRP